VQPSDFIWCRVTLQKGSILRQTFVGGLIVSGVLELVLRGAQWEKVKTEIFGNVIK
jgi:hypothetical protein